MMSRVDTIRIQHTGDLGEAPPIPLSSPFRSPASIQPRNFRLPGVEARVANRRYVDIAAAERVTIVEKAIRLLLNSFICPSADR